MHFLQFLLPGMVCFHHELSGRAILCPELLDLLSLYFRSSGLGTTQTQSSLCHTPPSSPPHSLFDRHIQSLTYFL
jgi:hypothetical protein